MLVNTITKLVPAARTAIPSRSINVISGPPRNRVSFGEKVAHGIVIASCLVAYPIWVLGHIKEYKGGK
uniref:Putative cytochrome c oxidase subunit viii n=1 Tax=Corethrella appendiculata TaxID=1370023 RepID=U5EGA8_9DIPT